MTAIKVTQSGDNTPQLRVNTGNHTSPNTRDQSKDKKTVSAAGLNLEDSSLAERKANAKKQAMNVVTQAFGKEQRIGEAAKTVEDDIVRRLNKLPDLEKKLEEAEKNLDTLRTKYGVKEKDELDLELRQLAGDIFFPQQPYESAGMARRRQQEAWNNAQNHESGYIREGIHEALTILDSEDELFRNKTVIKEEHQALSDLERERLADTSMRDALENAERIEDAASRDTILQAAGEVKDGMDEESEEIAEEMEEIREERKQREKESGKEDPLDIDVLQSEEQLRMQSLQSSVVSEVDAIVNRMSLINDDIKGIEIDDLL